jgi:hypothetical protein
VLTGTGWLDKALRQALETAEQRARMPGDRRDAVTTPGPAVGRHLSIASG